MKLWGGRFREDQDELMQQFNDSFRFDRRLYAVDIQGSRAFAQALHQVGLLTHEELESIDQGLRKIKAEFDVGEFEEKVGDEDIHTAVERRLTELIGEIGGKLHTGRSRNDQVAVDLRLYTMEEIDQTISLVEVLQHKIIEKAKENLNVVMPGFTHLQPAQPVLFSHWMMRFFWMLERDKSRLRDARERTSTSPLGCGALAGNPFGIDRDKLAGDLGMKSVSMNSLDAVSDRDFVAEFLFVLSLIAVHISQFAEDVILFSNPGFGFLQVGEAYSTGSSLMPQKRNPDSMELARGKSGRIISALIGLLFVLKGLPSTYNKDLQEDKEGFFDAIDNLSMMLSITAGVVESLIVYPKKMEEHLDEAMLATEIADYLVSRGIPFREAHHQTGAVIRYAEENKVALSEVPLAVYQEIAPKFEEDLYELFDFERAVNRKNSIGGTALKSVSEQIEIAKKKLLE